MNERITELYRKFRTDNAYNLNATQAILWARTTYTRERVTGRFGLDWEDSHNGMDRTAIVELPLDTDADTLAKWHNPMHDRPDATFVARIRCTPDDECQHLLDGIGEFTNEPSYPSSFWTRPTPMRPRSINRRHAGIHVERHGFDWFTPDCDPWDERKYWGGSKHDRFLRACACARGQWEYAERVASGDVYPVGYVVEVWDTSTLGWDDDNEQWDLDSADPISEDSCWGFDGSVDDVDADVWDVLTAAWHGAQTERTNADAWANQNVATR